MLPRPSLGLYDYNGLAEDLDSLVDCLMAVNMVNGLGFTVESRQDEETHLLLRSASNVVAIHGSDETATLNVNVVDANQSKPVTTGSPPSYHDYLRCQTQTFPSVNSRPNKEKEPVNRIPNSYDFDHRYTSFGNDCDRKDGNCRPASNSSEDLEENSYSQPVSQESHFALKELLASALDFITELKETLTGRDRQIQALKAENETLRRQIGRQARRSRAKGESEEAKSTVSEGNTHSSAPTKVRKSVISASPTPATSSRTQSEKYQEDKESANTSEDSSEPPLTRSRDRKPVKQEKHSSRVETSEETERPSGPMLRDSTHNRHSGVKHEEMKPLLTRKHYDRGASLSVQRLHSHTDRESLHHSEEGVVELPGWQSNPLSRLFCLEGTEDLSDDVFTKRHMKPENDEKRRKRWDMQQLRDQKQYEKLKQKYEKQERKQRRDEGKEDVPHSFYPSPKRLRMLHVSDTDEIPVCAFGVPLPDLSDKYFSLPWGPKANEVTKREKEGDGGRRQRRR